MDIEKMIRDMQDVLSEHEELRGCKVKMTVDFGSEPKLHMQFIVPEEDGDEGHNDPEVLIMSAMQMVHDQMGLIQDKMIAPDLDGKEVAEMSMAMNELSRSLSFLFNDYRVRMVSKETRTGDDCHE